MGGIHVLKIYISKRSLTARLVCLWLSGLSTWIIVQRSCLSIPRGRRLSSFPESCGHMSPLPIEMISLNMNYIIKPRLALALPISMARSIIWSKPTHRQVHIAQRRHNQIFLTSQPQHINISPSALSIATRYILAQEGIAPKPPCDSKIRKRERTAQRNSLPHATLSIVFMYMPILYHCR